MTRVRICSIEKGKACIYLTSCASALLLQGHLLLRAAHPGAHARTMRTRVNVSFARITIHIHKYETNARTTLFSILEPNINGTATVTRRQDNLSLIHASQSLLPL